MERGAEIIHDDGVAARPADDVALPHGSRPNGLQHRPDDRGFGAEQGKGEELEDNAPPELLYRECGKDESGSAQLRVASIEEPAIKADASARAIRKSRNCATPLKVYAARNSR